MKRISATCLLFAFAAGSHASAGDLTVTRSSGAIGDTLTYALSGDPGDTYYLVPSINQGPVPVGLFCPGDPRVILLGSELLSLGSLGVLDGGGNGTVNYPVPSDPTFQGVPLYAQVMTLFAPGCLVDDLSAQNAYALAQHDTVHDTVGDSAVARQGHTATALADGTVLVAGGDEPDTSGSYAPVDSLEVYDPQTQRFTLLAATLPQPRSTHTATLLADGRVLLLGGYDGTETVVATGEIFDPVAGTVTSIAPMSSARTQHTATLLADGRVLVAGGSSKFDLNDVLGSLAEVHNTAEVYDPVTNAWTSTPMMPGTEDGVVGQGASLLGNGQVLLTAGVRVAIVFGIPIPSMTNTCLRYEPTTNSWVGTASLPGARVYHGQVTMPDGRAVIVGGADGDFILLSFNTLSSCARYDANTNAWTSVGSLVNARAYPNLVLTGDELVVAGGMNQVDVSTGSGTPEQAIEVVPHTLTGWTQTASMSLPREVGRAVATEGGDRIVIVGVGDNGVTAVDTTAEVYVR